MSDETKQQSAVAATEEAPKETKSETPKKRDQKIVRHIKKGQAHIQATYNNTIVGISDMNGNMLGWSSSGSMGFKGSKKSTPYAAGLVVEKVVNRVRDSGLEEVEVFVKGIGSGREAAVRALQANGLTVVSIKDVTPIPHNGCRPRKMRRV